MKAEMKPYTRFDQNRRDPSLWHQSYRKESSQELYQISEGVLGYSNIIDLQYPPTLIVHPFVCDMNRYKPFVEKHTGLVIILEEDHELYNALLHFESLKRFKIPILTKFRNSFCAKSAVPN